MGVKWPFSTKLISSKYGDTRGRPKPHGGVDFGVRRASLIRAGGRGIVHFAGHLNNTAGTVVSIRYDGFAGTAMFCHLMTNVPVRKGQRVTADTIIGYVGSTGNSSGPHLHLELWRDRGPTRVNPNVLFGVVAAVKAAVKKVVSKKLTTASFGRVDVVQRALKTRYPAYAGRLVIDNQDGPRTRAAVKEFQRRSGLKPDGIAGPATRHLLGV